MPRHSSPTPRLSYRIKGIARIIPRESRDMNVIDTHAHAARLYIRRSRISICTKESFSKFYRALHRLQLAGIIREGPISFIYQPPVPFFKRLRNGRIRPRVNVRSFLLEPDIVRRNVPDRYIQQILKSNPPYQYPPEKLRCSIRLIEKAELKEIKRLEELKRIAAESLLDGSFLKHLNNPKHPLAIARRDKTPKDLDTQLKEYRQICTKRRYHLFNHKLIKWIYPDIYTTNPNMYTFEPLLYPMTIILRPASLLTIYNPN